MQLFSLVRARSLLRAFCRKIRQKSHQNRAVEVDSLLNRLNSYVDIVYARLNRIFQINI